MWATIVITAAVLILVGGMIYFLIRAEKRRANEQRDEAIREAERRSKDAEIAARPMRERPFTGPGGVFGK